MKRNLNIFILLFTAVMSYAQTNPFSTTENYVYTKNCLDADCVKKAETVQYFDGLGRPKQVVGIKASPAQKDVVNHIEYDGFGRILKFYLPVPQTGTQNGAIYENPLDNATHPDIYGAEKIYAEQVVENAPLTRIKKSFSTGNAWADKPVSYSYNTNTSASEVKKYSISTIWVEGRTDSQLGFTGAYYPVNTLMKTSVTDEDGNTATEYKNGKGQTVLIRKNDGTQDVDTYYIYNEYNQLAFVLPPLASALASVDETKRNSLCYQYRYDDFGRLAEKRIPGKGWEYLVYDKQDRVVLTQDALLAGTTNNFAKKGWMFTKYDKFGRVVYTGFFANTASRASMQTAVNNMSANAGNNEERSTTPFTLNGMDVYYTKNAFPTGSMTVLGVNYYDTYPPLPAGVTIPTQVLGQDVLSQDAQNASVSTKTLPTASYTKNIEDNNWTKDFIWYDNEGRTIGSHSVNHLGGYTKTEALLDFTGVVQKTNTYHLRKTGETGVTVKERFVYDPQYRLLKHYHQVDSRPEELLTENSYNELSQIKNKKVGNNIQSIDYAYNIRGWLTDINKEQMEVPDLGGKLFSYKVKYNQKQGINNPDPVLFPGRNVTERYNGNIAEVDWRSVETIGASPSLIPKRYSYVYDKLNRLSAGYYQNPGNAYSKENTESLDYDVNGNITDLYRTSITEYGSTTATLIDKLKYDYNGNQATSINDYSYNQTGYEGGGQLIKYDLNGNMTEMPDKGIDAIKYNYLNLSNFLHLNRNGIEDITINTKYSADGTKLRKENTTIITGFAGFTTSKTTVDYLDGFQYSITESPNTGGGGGSSEMFSARAMQPQAYSPEQNGLTAAAAKTADLQFMPTAEGFYDYINDQYIYQYKDHLGNIRVSFARNSAGVLQLKDHNDYYPFGMNHLKMGNSYFGAASYVKYKFGGKELQETGMYDFGARMYMADIGRWGVADPMAEALSDLSPYNYANNNPIMFVDPNGMLAQGVIDHMWNIGGEWHNTGSGFSYGSHEVSYNGDYSFNYVNAEIPGISFNGKGNEGTWNLGNNYLFNSYSMYNAILQGLNGWNFQTRARATEERLAGVINDGPIQYVGGAGDPLGVWEAGGMALSANSGGKGSYILAALMITRSGNTGSTLKLLNAEKGILASEKGSFSVADWSSYPSAIPMPTGPFKILEGAEYDAARKAANKANQAIRKANPEAYKGLEIHEIHPVKYGGSAIDPANKIAIPRDYHRKFVTPWWNNNMRSIKKIP